MDFDSIITALTILMCLWSMGKSLYCRHKGDKHNEIVELIWMVAFLVILNGGM